ncbi:MAG: 4Fe-4S binding protein [Firmicutes bacterium]|nr:4Fe-4S binding protein [Bacillota bacterium]
MKFIEFDPYKCDSCYKCLRVCPTKAIAFCKSDRKIIDDLCIKCGLCEIHCHHDALKITNCVYKVKRLIKSEQKVAVSLAPSYISSFSIANPGSIITSLKKLGFDIVEETAFGAEVISQLYTKEIKNGFRNNLITSCCPSANYYIERYFPSTIKYMMPVVSPMVAHGRYIKGKYGADTKVVFIGPCLAKKAEAEEFSDSIDSVLTFSELEEWLEEENINLSKLEASDPDSVSTLRGKAYPMGGSLWDSEGEKRYDNIYRHVRVNGIDQCRELLDAMSKGKINNYCVEINICKGSCINGPDLPSNAPTYFERENLLFNNIKNNRKNNKVEKIDIDPSINLETKFSQKPILLREPSDKELKEILMEMGKYKNEDLLNCKACGYETCIDKAKAVHNGYSDSKLCLDYLKKKAESLQSVMFENIPNPLCIVDEELNILDVNPAFNRTFNDRFINMRGFPIYALLSEEDLLMENETGEKIQGRKVFIEDLDKTFYINSVFLEDESIRVVIFTDITVEEKSKNELELVKERTLSACNEVINKQMRVAQEIASLLGETTAETKINLNKLKSIVLDNGGR